MAAAAWAAVGPAARAAPGAAAPHLRARSAAATARLATPILSARRVPDLLARTVARARLTSSLDAALADPAIGAAAQASCLVVDDGPEPLFAARPTTPLVPASTLKLVTATAALRRLGAGFRFVTEVRAAAPPAGGVVDGPLWLVGSGDPVIQTGDYSALFEDQPRIATPLEALADALVAAGVHEVRGPVVGDESRYDTVRYLPVWKPRYVADNEVGPISALSVNDGFAQYSRTKAVAAADPAANAAGVLTSLLRARGVVVDAEAAAGAAPQGASALASVTSPPLSEIVKEMLQDSDNQTAEMLVKELGARFRGAGTWEAGLAVARTDAVEAGIPPDQYAAVDGSGLDRSDRLTCAALVDALDASGPSGPLAAGLPVAGQSGTLHKRLVGSAAAGRLRAKTGTLDNVAGLAGFVDRPGARPLTFALLANDLPDRTATGRALQDRIGLALAAYPDAPAAAVLAPRPPTSSSAPAASAAAGPGHP